MESEIPSCSIPVVGEFCKLDVETEAAFQHVKLIVSSLSISSVKFGDDIGWRF